MDVSVLKERDNLSEVEVAVNQMKDDDGNDIVDDAESAALDRKIDFKLDCLVIPLVTMVYLLAFLDRANLGNARVVSTSQAFSCSVSMG